MKTNNNFPGRFGRVERFKIDAKCPVCGSLYDFGRLDVIQEEEGATLMYIKCSVCQSSALSVIALGAFGLKVASTITDLERDEVAHFQEGQPVKSEEVLELHEIMSSNLKFLDKLD